MRPATDEKLPFNFTDEGDRHYQVRLFGVDLGAVYYDPEAWSDGRWFVAGKRQYVRHYAANPANKVKKPVGWPSRYAAAKSLATMRSGDILKAAPVEGCQAANP